MVSYNHIIILVGKRLLRLLVKKSLVGSLIFVSQFIYFSLFRKSALLSLVLYSIVVVSRYR